MKNLNEFRLFFLALIAFVAFLSSSGLKAQDEFEEVKVLDHPRYSLTDRLALDADFVFLPLDAYYKPLLLELALSYQPTDWFSWEVARVGYSVHNVNTNLAAGINTQVAASTGNQFEISDTGLKLKDMRYHVASTGYFNLLYSKSNFFNQGIAYYYWQLGSGFSYYDMKSVNQMALDLAMRVRFFLNNHWSLNIRGGQSIGFKSEAPSNITFLSLGVGFAF